MSKTANSSTSTAEFLPNAEDAHDTSGLYASGPVRMLVVDDDRYIGTMIQKVFSSHDFKVDICSDPEQVESVLRSASYHLVILDYVLPGLDPPQVMDWVRHHQSEASVVVVTGYPSLDSALHCLRAHIDDYLTKPFGVDQLRRTVMRCLDNRGLLRLSEEALRKQLGASIRERRNALGLTLAELGQRAGVSLGYLSQIELGKNSASVETLYRIALGLRVRVAELFESIQAKL